MSYRLCQALATLATSVVASANIPRSKCITNVIFMPFDWMKIKKFQKYFIFFSTHSEFHSWVLFSSFPPNRIAIHFVYVHREVVRTNFISRLNVGQRDKMESIFWVVRHHCRCISSMTVAYYRNLLFHLVSFRFVCMLCTHRFSSQLIAEEKRTNNCHQALVAETKSIPVKNECKWLEIDSHKYPPKKMC